MEVEVREEMSPPDSTTLLASNSSQNSILDAGPVVIVRAEEVLLVALVLILWVAAIALFFNRWGKIRMLEPYQPKFQSQNHRPSCPLAPLSPPHITPQQRMSFSKYNVNCFADMSALPSPNAARRPRLNSVFVGSSSMSTTFMNPPRRTKSAFDIQHLVQASERGGGPRRTFAASMLPMIGSVRDAPPAHCHVPRRRPSMSTERPLLSHYQQFRNRRSSCAIERFEVGRQHYHQHRNFISCDQPRRKASIACVSHQGPLGISFEPPLVVVNRPKGSRSFEVQPADKMLPLPRMANSLDTTATNCERRTSAVLLEEDVIITFDEADVTANAPLLQRLKSSDV